MRKRWMKWVVLGAMLPAVVVVSSGLSIVFGAFSGTPHPRKPALPQAVKTAVLASAAAAVGPNADPTVVRFAPITWKDASMGVPAAAQPCTNVTTQGFVVWVLTGKDSVSRYHTNEDGSVVRLAESGIGPATVATAPLPDAQSGSPGYALEHVVFGKTQLDLLTTGAWAPCVHAGRDSFMLMSGNRTGDINCSALNFWARDLKRYYPNARLYAATSGIKNVRDGTPCLNRHLFTGMVMVYEPNQPNAPEFSWDRATTEATFTEAATIIHSYGLQAWSKPSGRAAAGRDHFGDWDYGALANIMDGMVIQTQASCQDPDGNGDYTDGPSGFNVALQSIVQMYQAAGATSRLVVRVTASSPDANPNALPAEAAMQCAQAAWATPRVDWVALRTGADAPSIAQGGAFLEERDSLILQ